MIKGSIAAIVTPMLADGTIDKKSFHDLIEWHIAEKTDAIVVAGSTGEGIALTEIEQQDLIATAVKQAAKRIPVIAGAGSNNTRHAIQLAQNAKNAGVDACLIVTPYYCKPPQNGLVEHFKRIAESVSIPIILYNVPSRTGVDMLPETVERLSTIPTIIGIKDATGKLDRTLDMLKRCPANFVIYSGDDPTAMELMFNGAKGVISISSNVVPRKMHDLCEAAMSGNKSLAEKIDAELALLHKRLCIEANPIPVKWVLNKMGKIPAGIRLPLLPLDAKYHADVLEAMTLAGITLKAKQNVTS